MLVLLNNWGGLFLPGCSMLVVSCVCVRTCFPRHRYSVNFRLYGRSVFNRTHLIRNGHFSAHFILISTRIFCFSIFHFVRLLLSLSHSELFFFLSLCEYGNIAVGCLGHFQVVRLSTNLAINTNSLSKFFARYLGHSFSIRFVRG